MEAWHYWLILAIIFIAIEMLTADFFLALLGVAALAAGVAAGAGMDFTWQLGIFVAGSILMLATVRPAVKNWLYRTSTKVSTNAEGMVGMLGTVEDPVGGSNAPGRVKLGSEEWRAVAEDNEFTIESGTTVEVLRVDGATVHVRPRNTERKENDV